MENKYYVPEIEEFHVGFEYEYKKSKGVWEKEKIETSISSEHGLCVSIPSEEMYGFKSVNLRVKNLDREDIESLGWMQRDYDTFDFKTKKEGLGYALAFNPEFSTFIYQTGYKNGTIFQGTIKNKNELKRLMKQLNIE